ncbi:hypothetical protein BS47DRAFT_1385784 [Hydnum rufescens UP504]|uniref:HNH nuclease domain-containing protein n=1 Tax=Hydnum rufescens UP504 TaxID=1448309 RepID=A0A9P6AHI5_9AGAM|nr:hypothetical protein BS47DRAFT_1385784 [Hydnum rufescens UP504]
MIYSDSPRPSMDPLPSSASISSILTSASYQSLIGTSTSTETLVLEARNNLDSHKTELQELVGASTCYAFLLSMLEYAPTPLGQRHVACVVLQTDDDIAALSKCAVDWYHFLVFLVREADKTGCYEPIFDFSNTRTLTYKEYMKEVDNSPRRTKTLRKQACNLLLRDNDRCIISGSIDIGSKNPTKESSTPLQISHIIPWSLNNLYGMTEVAKTGTWDMLQNFVGIDIAKFPGGEINHPSNAFLSTLTAALMFSSFMIYFDSTDTPHKYIVRTFYKNEFANRTVTFRDHSGSKGPISLPDPDLLAVQGAFAKVINASGAAAEPDQLWDELVLPGLGFKSAQVRSQSLLSQVKSSPLITNQMT